MSKSARLVGNTSLNRTFSQGYAAQTLHRAGSMLSFDQIAQDVKEMKGLFSTSQLLKGLQPAPCREKEVNVMELIHIASSAQESDSIPALHEQLVDPEIAWDDGFWSEVGTPESSSSPSRASSGAESIGPVEGHHSGSTCLPIHQEFQTECTDAAESQQTTILLPWDM